MTHPIVWASIVPVRVATYYYCIDKFGRSYPLTEFCHVQNSLCVHLRTIAQVCRAMSVFAIKACMDNRKKLLNSNTSSTCPDNMMNFGLLTAEIGWRVWGTPANFNVSRLGSVTARHSSNGRQPNFAVLNRGRHLHSAGRPSRGTCVLHRTYVYITHLDVY